MTAYRGEFAGCFTGRRCTEPATAVSASARRARSPRGRSPRRPPSPSVPLLEALDLPREVLALRIARGGARLDRDRLLGLTVAEERLGERVEDVDVRRVERDGAA